jgi:hypothetical protein
MNSFFQILAPRAFNLIFAASVVGLTACSTGTKPGDTNVETGSTKDKNPNERDAPGHNTNSSVQTHEDSINALMDTGKVKNDAYERSKETQEKRRAEPKENYEEHK